jgi:di/tricarboxylate transporter
MFEPWQQQVFLAVLVVVVFTAFVREWLSVELVALGGLFACVVTGILPVAPDDAELAKFDALRVFAHPAPITVACMFVLSAALDKTGVIDGLGHFFERKAATSPLRMLLALMLLVALLSGFMNNTPVVVVFMPIVLAICRRKDWKASRYLMPLSYAAIAGGTLTIVGTSTNMISAAIMKEHGFEPFTMFEVTKLGAVVVVLVVGYMMTVGRRLLPDRVTLAALIDSERSREFITHAWVAGGSPLVGRKFTDTVLAKLRQARVLEVMRDGRRLRAPLDEIAFAEGDEIVFKGEAKALMELSEREDIEMGGGDGLGLEGMRTESAVLMEAIIGPDAEIAGKSLRELMFRQRFGVWIVAVHRRGENLRERFEDERLAFGDTLLMQGPADKMQQMFKMKDFVNLSAPKGEVHRVRKAPVALLAIGLFMLAGALTGLKVLPEIPIVVLAMGAALMVLVSGCVQPAEAYAAIEWKVLFIIFGMLGLGLALERSGLAGLMAVHLVQWIGNHPHLLVAGLYLLAAVMTELISNNAVAALLTPLAIVVGMEAGLSDPRPLVVAVMFGASASFSTPIGYQTNTFVYGAGGYRFGDFFRTGAPLAVLVWITASLLIPILWPFEF